MKIADQAEDYYTSLIYSIGEGEIKLRPVQVDAANSDTFIRVYDTTGQCTITSLGPSSQSPQAMPFAGDCCCRSAGLGKDDPGCCCITSDPTACQAQCITATDVYYQSSMAIYVRIGPGCDTTSTFRVENIDGTAYADLPYDPSCSPSPPPSLPPAPPSVPPSPPPSTPPPATPPPPPPGAPVPCSDPMGEFAVRIRIGAGSPQQPSVRVPSVSVSACGNLNGNEPANPNSERWVCEAYVRFLPRTLCTPAHF